MRLVGCLFLAAIALTGARAASADPLKIHVGWSTMPGHMIPVLFLNPKILRHYGQSYTVELVAFRGSSPQLTAMAAGEVDLMASSPGTMALAVLNAGLDVKVVADIIQDGVPGYHTETWLVRADSGINSVADLKGKRIGTNAIGSAADTAMRAVMAKNGMQDRRDFVTIQASFASMLALLEEKKVDAAPILQPLLNEARKQGGYREIFTSKDGIGQADLVFLLGQADFLAKNRAAVTDFTEDYVRAQRWFADPANRTESLKIIANFMKIQPSELNHLFTTDDYYRDAFCVPNLEALQSSINIAHDVGLLPNTIAVPKYADLSFVEEAKRRIIAAP